MRLIMINHITGTGILLLAFASHSLAGSLNLSSQDMSQGKFLNKAQEFNGFGCSGDDLSPQLSLSLIHI